MIKTELTLASRIALAGAAILGTATTAHAMPIEFVIADVPTTSVNLTITGDTAGVSDPFVTYANGLGNTAFSLDLDGGPTSHTFDFFRIWVDNYSGADYGGGYIHADISATLAFEAPGGDTGGTAGVALSYYTRRDSSGWGSCWWGCDYDTYFGSGSLIWDPQPANVLLDDGTEFSVTLSDIPVMSSGYNTVSATVELINAPAPRPSIPEPGTLALLGLGLLGLGVAPRRSICKA